MRYIVIGLLLVNVLLFVRVIRHLNKFTIFIGDIWMGKTSIADPEVAVRLLDYISSTIFFLLVMVGYLLLVLSLAAIYYLVN